MKVASAEEKKENKRGIMSGALIAFALCFTLFIYAPYELYVTNQLEFWFTAGQMLPYVLGLFAAAFLAILLVLYIARRINEKLYNLVSAACLVALICSWVQGSFLVWDLPPMDGKPVDWGSFPVDRICSIALWVIVIAAVLVLVKKLGGSRLVKLGSYASLAIAFILAVTLGTVFLTTELSDKSRALIATDEDMFTYSEDDNLLILVLDAVDSTAFEQSMARDAHYSEIFSDFTYFRNTVGGYPYSQLSIPLILTGQWYEAQESFADYERAAYASSPLLERLDQEGYRKGLYLYDSYSLAAISPDSFENLTQDQPVPDSALYMCKLMIKMTIIKHAPWDLKYLGYDLPGRLNESVKYGGDGDLSYFNWSDLAFYNTLKNDSPITSGGEKRFKYIHLEGAHEPHVYDKDFNVLESSPYRDVIEANFTMLDLFLSQMKQAGVYDNTAIVIMADHGSHNDTDLRTINQNPILLIKGRGERHDELTVSYAPVSYDDLQQAYQRLLDGEGSDGVFDWHEGDARARRFLWYEMADNSLLTEYEQTGSAEDMTTLKPTGTVYERK